MNNMWDILKNKVSNFISNLTNKEEDSEKKEEIAEEIPEEKVDQEKIDEKEENKEGEEEAQEDKVNEEKKKDSEEEEEHIEEKVKVGPNKTTELSGGSQEGPIKEEVKEEIEVIEKERKVDEEIKESEGSKEETPKKPGREITEEKKVEDAREEKKQFLGFLKKPKKEAPKRKSLVGIKEKIVKAVLRKVKLDKNKVEELADELELELIQSDVHPDIAMKLVERIKEELPKREFEDPDKELPQAIGEIFYEETFKNMPSLDIIDYVRNCEKPCKILFVGPNGAGKTTTIAKIAHKLMKEGGFKVVISASDTFRAAAIEQAEEHGKRLGVRVIKHQYGADAAAVAFDAVKHAEAKGLDAVLIDSAGRQETNKNLMRELEKLRRIIKPDLTLMVVEATSGSSIFSQVEEYNKIVPLDGIILTKIDCDAKGGASLSIYKETGIPIYYLGRGQKYEDLEVFDGKKLIEEIISSS